MQYEEALRLWGKKKLEEVGYENIDLDTVTVDMHFDRGYCSHGEGSMDESPIADVVIEARREPYWWARRTIPVEDFDFVEVLKELVDIADGNITK